MEKPPMNVKTVAQAMTSLIISVKPDDTLRLVGALFRQHSFHHLLVMESHKLVGILSDRDYWKVMSPFLETYSERDRDVAILDRKVHQIMARNPVTIAPEASLIEAGQILVSKGFSCLPVVNGRASVQGIITWRDILKMYVSSTQNP